MSESKQKGKKFEQDESQSDSVTKQTENPSNSSLFPYASQQMNTVLKKHLDMVMKDAIMFAKADNRNQVHKEDVIKAYKKNGINISWECSKYQNDKKN